MFCSTFRQLRLVCAAPQFLLAAFTLLLLAFGDSSLTTAHAQTKKRAMNVPGQRAVVIDERFSALREQPDVKAALIQRLRRGRIVGILKSGRDWHQVYLTRRRRGWLPAEAVVRSGRTEEAARLLRLIEETRDEFTQARLARICADEFRHTTAAPRALRLLGEAAEAAANRLTRDARRRTGEEAVAGDVKDAGARRELMLNYSGLDRWNRAGILFEYEPANDRILYDGAAYREIAKKYPRSAEVKAALEKLGSKK